MKVLIINSVCGIRSTGRIAAEIAQQYIREGNEAIVAFGREFVPEEYRNISKRIGTQMSINRNVIETRIFDNDGFTARQETKEFLRWADEYNPDVLWLHNLHGYYINVEFLFNWIKSRPSMKVNWTFHDCWPFTGHCTYFTYADCDKWLTHCDKCKQKKEYPASYVFDRSNYFFERKKELFTGVTNLTIITPSNWLAGLVKKSFLKDYEVKVQHNTINKEIFKPTSSDIKERLGITDKKLILGVAIQWQASKGYYDFFKLADVISDEYAIIMVGLTAEEHKEIPKKIIGIERTNNVQELVELYTAADVFFNPTYEDNYPTVNLEAIACGTTVLTYDCCGSAESAAENCVIVQPGNFDEIIEGIKRICEGN